MDKSTRYRIASDNSGHEYFIPADKSDEWEKWTEIPEDDERSWKVPEWAGRIDGTFTFTNPES